MVFRYTMLVASYLVSKPSQNKCKPNIIVKVSHETTKSTSELNNFLNILHLFTNGKFPQTKFRIQILSYIGSTITFGSQEPEQEAFKML